jgi:hypothetical protein
MSFDRPFRGSAAIEAGVLTRGQLRGPGLRRLFHDVSVSASVPVDLALRSRGAHLLVAGTGGGAVRVLSGRGPRVVLRGG